MHECVIFCNYFLILCINTLKNFLCIFNIYIYIYIYIHYTITLYFT
ncbi:MAG: hypothetical protein N7Q72_02325 [Spiroplasma sp. Tabriz.8]|nr:hypothetical protein [Spiroplasma sp. Tabriz.8]